MNKIDPAALEQVLRHHIGTHGLRFHATISGVMLSDYELKPTCEFLGVTVEEANKGIAFAVRREGDIRPLQFSTTDKGYIETLKVWLKGATENLSTEQCKMYAKLPKSVILSGGVSECIVVNTYTKKSSLATAT